MERTVEAYALVLVEDDDDWAAYHRIRRLVLFESRGRFDYLTDEPEECKPENLSLLLKYREQPVGAVRLDTRPDGKAIVRLVAIATSCQRQGHGTVPMTRVEELANKHAITELWVHAAPDAVGFYRKLGYSPFDFEKGHFGSMQLCKCL